MSGLFALMIVLFVLAVPMFVLGMMNQRKLWWKIAAWRYKDPSTHEPSETFNTWNRFGYFFGGGVMVVMGFVFLSMIGSYTFDASGVRSHADQAASVLEEEEPAFSFGPTESEIEWALEQVAPSGALRLEERGDSEDGDDRYEITNRNGEHPVCLTVGTEGGLTDEDPETTATVDEGPC